MTSNTSSGAAYTVSILNTKGGVGKSTLAANLGALAADLGQRVLLIDCDPQISLSKFFPLADKAPYGISHVLTERDISAQCISCTTISGLDVIVADAKLQTTVDDLRGAFQPEFALEQAIREIQKGDLYDLVIIDTQGATGLIQDIAVVPADLILSPILPETVSIRQIDDLQRLLARYAKGAPNHRVATLPCKGIVWKQTRTTDARMISEAMRHMFTQSRGRISLCSTVIPQAKAYTEAATGCRPVHRHEPMKHLDDQKSASWHLHQLVWEVLPHLHGRVAHLLDDATLFGANP